jgi:hypothetical protein
MCDWIVNGANDLGVDTIRIDILKKEIQPSGLMIHPLLVNLDYLNRIVEKTLISNDLPINYIKEVIFEIKVTEEKRIICSSYSVADNGRAYKSKDYIETSYERFIAINPSITQKIILGLRKPFDRFRFYLIRKANIGNLRYTRKLDS